MNPYLLPMLTIYLLIINLLAFSAMAFDKFRAVRGGWRVRERTLLWLGFLGGALSELLAMLLFRHKIRHKKFTVLLPLFLILHLALSAFLYLNFIGG